jgi:hypothetical protein
MTPPTDASRVDAWLRNYPIRELIAAFESCALAVSNMNCSGPKDHAVVPVLRRIR